MKAGDIVVIDRDISNSEYFEGKKFELEIRQTFPGAVFTEGTVLVIAQVDLGGIDSRFDYRAYRLGDDVHNTFLICDSWLRPVLVFELLA